MTVSPLQHEEMLRCAAIVVLAGFPLLLQVSSVARLLAVFLSAVFVASQGLLMKVVASSVEHY